MEKDYKIPDIVKESINNFKRSFRNFILIFFILNFGICYLFGFDAAMVSGFTMAFFAFILLVVNASKANKKHAKNLESHSYSWYKNNFPESSENGRIHCRFCGDHRISVRNLMNGTFVRSHSCVQCGETLYYSPERV
ncbi:hypothetical protein [Actimicrobium antarcticum]|uniref:hypothetical protein n=1 Tax=Actimicrobium antarcticum TaxID=1051899 RepID=UPI0031D44DD8